MAKIQLTRGLRLSFLILGLFPAAFYLVFLAGAAISELLDGKMAVIPLFILIFFTLSGYILAWKKLRPGAWIMMAGSMMMGVLLLIESGFRSLTAALFYMLPFLILGAGLLVVNNIQRSETHKS